MVTSDDDAFLKSLLESGRLRSGDGHIDMRRIELRHSQYDVSKNCADWSAGFQTYNLLHDQATTPNDFVGQSRLARIERSYGKRNLPTIMKESLRPVRLNDDQLLFEGWRSAELLTAAVLFPISSDVDSSAGIQALRV